MELECCPHTAVLCAFICLPFPFVRSKICLSPLFCFCRDEGRDYGAAHWTILRAQQCADVPTAQSWSINPYHSPAATKHIHKGLMTLLSRDRT
ncbi:hypothetical protein GDO81_029663 [Engystomops pustulosus]|uniref:Secreted protein n=1 Tax=Engystomops pustulosus TaxID=76066 RepID=A0AAV6YII4_ENGPU|nr:hypothetical protein GDO81_029663 [Engystomops pustulosus]